MKTRKYLIIITLSVFLTFILFGCANGSNALYSNTGNQPPSDTTGEPASDVETSREETHFVYGNVPLEDIADSSGNYDLKVCLTKEQADHYIDSIEQFAPIYKYEDLYQLDKALEKEKSYKKAKTHSSMISEITGDAIYETVIKNNKAYLDSLDAFAYEEFKKKELKKICKKIADVVNNQIEISEDVDQDEMKCKLNRLVVLKNDIMMVNACVTSDYRMLISPDTISIVKGKDKDVMMDIVTHETIHLVQMECPDTIALNGNFEARYGFSTDYDELEVNSLSLLWLVEASAEKCMCTYENIEPITYEYMVGYLESLALTELVNDDYRVGDMEHLIYKDTVEDLYDFFDAKTDSEKRELLNMLYSIQIIEQEPEDLKKAYDDYLGHEADENEFGQLLSNAKCNALLTISRLFYKNLTKKLSERDISIGDVFYMISVYELDLNNHITYNYSGGYERKKSVIEQYLQIQDEFFATIAPNVNMTKDELIDSFNAYTYKYIGDDGTEVANYNLSWLGNDKIDYLSQRIEKFDKVLNVRQAYEQLK